MDALPKIILRMNMFVKQDIKMSAAMKAFNTNLRLPAQPLFDIFEKSTTCVDRTNDLVTHDWKQTRLAAVVGLATSPWTSTSRVG